jgi:hypothetical protein
MKNLAKSTLCLVLFLILMVPAQAADLVVVSVVNTTGQDAEDLHVTFTGTNGNIFVDPWSVIALRCPVPDVPSNGTVTDTAVIDWGAPCVPAGSTVTFLARTTDGPLAFSSGFWTNGGVIGPVTDITVRRVAFPPGRFGALKVATRCIPNIPPIYTPWVLGGFPPFPCWARWCCFPGGVRYEYMVYYCPFTLRTPRLLEIPPWIPLTGWLPDGNFPASFYYWQFVTYGLDREPPSGPPANPPVPRGPRSGPWMQMLEVRNSDDGGVTFRPAADFASAFFNVFTDLQISTTNEPPEEIGGFSNILMRMAPGYAAAARDFTALLAELDDVLSAEPNPVLSAIQQDLRTIQSALADMASAFDSGQVTDPSPFDTMASALLDMAAQMRQLPAQQRFANASSNLMSMADGFNTAADMVRRGLKGPDQDVFLWALLDRFGPMMANLASGTMPHIRVQVDLGAWAWYPWTISQVHVIVQRADTRQIVDELFAPISDLGEFDIPSFDQNVPLNIWFKLPTHLSRVVSVIARDGLHVGPIPVIPGDVNGDNVIDGEDLRIVTKDQGRGGLNADEVPPSDVNGDGIVNEIDLSIVQQNQGRRGEQLP